MNRATKFSCSNCGNQFCKKKLLVVHMKEHGGNVAINLDKNVELELYGCEVCGKNFEKEKTLLQHKAMHNDKKFECIRCKTKFSLLKNLRRHEKESVSQSGNPAFACTMCDEYFCTGKLLGSHENSFHKRFTCPICAEPFIRKQHLERHVGNREAVFCAHCDKVFCNQKRFKEHMNIRHADKSGN